MVKLLFVYHENEYQTRDSTFQSHLLSIADKHEIVSIETNRAGTGEGTKHNVAAINMLSNETLFILFNEATIDNCSFEVSQGLISKTPEQTCLLFSCQTDTLMWVKPVLVVISSDLG